MAIDTGDPQTWANTIGGAVIGGALWIVRKYANKVDHMEKQLAKSVTREELARTVKDNTDRVEKALAEITGSHRVLQNSIDSIHDKLFDLAGRGGKS